MIFNLKLIYMGSQSRSFTFKQLIIIKLVFNLSMIRPSPILKTLQILLYIRLILIIQFAPYFIISIFAAYLIILISASYLIILKPPKDTHTL